MFSDHVHPELLQQPEIIHHGFQRGRQVDAIGPVSLVECSELENELAVQERSLDPLDDARLNGTKCRITLDRVVSHLDANVVDIWRVW